MEEATEGGEGGGGEGGGGEGGGGVEGGVEGGGGGAVGGGRGGKTAVVEVSVLPSASLLFRGSKAIRPCCNAAREAKLGKGETEAAIPAVVKTLARALLADCHALSAFSTAAFTSLVSAAVALSDLVGCEM